jgi:myo-inositol 2-dehydrogenase/D-chiro-inositol 1-dehydrogenase
MLNIAFIGCGGIARHHANCLAQVRGARVVAASDVVEESARRFAADYGAEHVFTDHRKMLKLDSIDAVWVCTPTYLHAGPVIAAAEAGKHAFCEKPMAMKMSDALRMAVACDKAGVLLTIGFVRRFDAQWGKFRDLIQAGAVGRPVIWRFAAGGKPPHPWFRDEKKGGGPLIDGAIHNYDFALQIFGPVESVQASSLHFDDTSVGRDTASAIVNFASGDQHSLIWSWGVEKGAEVTSLNDVIGPKGSLQFGMTAPEAPKNFDPTIHGAFTIKGGNGSAKVHTYRLRNMFVEQMKHVVKSFSKGEQPLVTGQDGIDALKIALAILKSGKTRRTVRI